MKIYVASSWRNLVQPGVVTALRAAGHDGRLQAAEALEAEAARVLLAETAKVNAIRAEINGVKVVDSAP